MPFTTLGRNRMLDALMSAVGPVVDPPGHTGTFYLVEALPVAYASLHSGPPTDAGLLEIAGGTPAYSRLPVAFEPGVGGAVALSPSANLHFNVPAFTSVAFVGLWTAVTAGEFLGYAPSSGGGVYGAATVSSVSYYFQCPAHGLVDGQAVIVSSVAGAALPTGLLPDTLYYVKNANPSSFQLADIFGAVIVIQTDGRVAWQRVAIDTFSTQGTVDIETLTFSLEG